MKNNLIKTSKKLNDLYSELIELYNSINYDHYDKIYMDLHNKAWKVCTEHSGDYRAVDYAEYIEEGVAAAIKSINTGKPIYCVSSCQKESDILFFIEDLDVLQDMFKSYIDQANQFKIDTEEKEIIELEKRLKKLSKKKKK